MSFAVNQVTVLPFTGAELLDVAETHDPADW